MKTIAYLNSRNGCRLVALVMILLFSCQLATHAQPVTAQKGYGNAVYQDLQDNIFLKNWLLLGPIPVSDKPGQPGQEMLKKAFDGDLFTSVSIDRKRPLPPVSVGGKQYSWQYSGSSGDTVQLHRILGDTNFVTCYALAEIIAPETKTLLFALGSDDGVKVWLNGAEVHKNYIGRAITRDEDLFEVTLSKGSNQILIKIQNGEFDYGFMVRPVSGTALHGVLRQSVVNGNLDDVKLAVKYGSALNHPDGTGLTPWQLATLKGRTEMADFLKSQGAQASETFPPLSAYVDSMLKAVPVMKAPGIAVLVAQNGKIVLEKCRGMADIGHSVPVTPITKFRIGSVTKQFVASAILKLQEEGRINISDPLTKFIPDFPRGDEVTIHHLLTHTSGIHSFTNRPDFLKYATMGTTTQEMVDTIKAGIYDFNPGENFQYNNSGYFLLGYIIEKITGKPYGQYLKETFFEPLGMTHTGVHTSTSILENEATGYAIGSNGFEKALDWDMSRAGGAGALYSTVEDLYTWNEAIFGGKVLQEQSLKAAFTPVTLKDGSHPTEMVYGYGWAVDNLRDLTVINHGGGLHGFLSQLSRQPDNDVTVAVLTNCAPAQENASPGQVANDIIEYLLWENMSKQQSYTTDTTLSPEDLKLYEGRFDYGGGMVLTVTAEEGKLYAQMSGQQRFEIFPRGGDEFYWKVVDARIRFLRNETGEITGAIHYQGGRDLNVKKMPDLNIVQVDQALLEKYAGAYEITPDVILTITAGQGILLAQPTGQGRIDLYPVAEDEFTAKEVNAVLRFIPDADGKYRIILRQGTVERTLNRIK
jgi:CubicO group peptidase (beta-lactamase class C family)